MHKIFTMAWGAGALILLQGTAMAADNPAVSPSPAAKTKQVEEAKPVVVEPQPKQVEVQSGESLSIIAEAQALESWRPIWDANAEISDPDVIYPGQKLVIPVEPTAERPLPAGVVAQPVAAVAPRNTQARGAVASANYAAGVGGTLERIRRLESGGNYAINTGNGYYGAYQFNLGTWRGVGGTGLPSEASPAEQDMRAQMLYDRRGCNPWPNTCK